MFAMPHDVFISYSSKDKPAADATVAVLEGRGIRCWIAPRDIVPGAEWSESIIEAIEGARVMVLLFSDHANHSPQIKREVERAVNRGVVIVPVRLEDVQPAKSLEYFISTPHWLDAFTPPLKKHIEYLAETVQHVLKNPGESAPRPKPKPAPLPVPWWKRRETAIVAGILALALLIWAVVALSGDGGEESDENDVGSRNGSGQATNDETEQNATTGGGDVASAALEEQGLSPFIGTWRVESAKPPAAPIMGGLPVLNSIMPNTMTARLFNPKSSVVGTFDQDGRYTVEIEFVSDGRYLANLNPVQYSRPPEWSGIVTMTPTGAAVGDRVEARFGEVEKDVPHWHVKQGDTMLTLTPPGDGRHVATWVRPGGPNQRHDTIVGAWASNIPLWVDSYFPYDATLEFDGDGNFRLRLTRTETGMLEVEDGRYAFLCSVAMGPPAAGRYKFDGPNRVTFTEPRGAATWVRVEE